MKIVYLGVVLLLVRNVSYSCINISITSTMFGSILVDCTKLSTFTNLQKKNKKNKICIKLNTPNTVFGYQFALLLNTYEESMYRRWITNT